jgi:CBS-domain-containing membrane protein
MTGGRHTAVCMLPDGRFSDWQQVSGGVPAKAVWRFMTADVPTVGAEAPLSALARTMIEAHVHTLIVLNEQHWPIGTVSCLDVLAALACPADAGRAVETE